MPKPDSATVASTQGEVLFPAGFVAALLLGVTLNPINSSILAKALVSIAGDFHATAMKTALLVSVLYLVSAVCQPLMGRMAKPVRSTGELQLDGRPLGNAGPVVWRAWSLVLAKTWSALVDD
ncbi:hypothetical protein BWP39_09930 [Paraburkholderia acidicola]|uniref:Uncharacterized protein n=1 Tax=Paraburkholderia acidicola TaxID=1912599 RepID=A0A2A4F3B8_9BURK|nr:hypothetical protein [Paraburkholderia acidicola]PCE27094.1 hypothetical protein BWP39_09930 [Paraburkholderia acidicola]